MAASSNMLRRNLISHEDDGFSLIEVLVVLVLISAVLVPLYQMQTAVSLASRKALDQALVSAALDRSVIVFETLNPIETPNGSVRFEDTILEWKSSIVQRHQRPSGLPGQVGVEVSLCSVDFQIRSLEGRQLHNDNVQLIGWSRDQ